MGSDNCCAIEGDRPDFPWKPALGVDIGSTYLRCAVYDKDGMVTVLSNGMGSKVTPAQISWTDDKYQIGDGALKQASKNPK